MLLDEAFAIFKDRSEKPPSESAFACLNELTPVACEFYDIEPHRRSRIQSVLNTHGLDALNVPETESRTDGNPEIKVMPAAIRGCKNEVGDGFNQVILYYAQFLRKAFDDPLHFYNFDTRFPCILMVDMGMSAHFSAAHSFTGYGPCRFIFRILWCSVGWEGQS